MNFFFPDNKLTTKANITGFMLVLFLNAQIFCQSIEENLSKIFNERDFCGSATLTIEGKTVFSNAYGMADRNKKIPNRTSTAFCVGSVTKQFTAMAIMILQEQRKLKVTDNVGKHLDNVPVTWKKIRIHQLLTHTSGIMHSWKLPEFKKNVAKKKSLDELLSMFYDKPLSFEPGDGFEYSGTGYFLLARIIEQASGMSYEQYLKKEIFEPLKMHSTGGDIQNANPSLRSVGYILGEGVAVQLAEKVDMSNLVGGGNLYSTSEDLCKWGNALLDQKLIANRSYRKYYKTEQNDYAYGWVVKEIQGVRVLSHSGGLPGYSSLVIQIPDHKVFMAIVSNDSSKNSSQTIQMAGNMVKKTIISNQSK